MRTGKVAIGLSVFLAPVLILGASVPAAAEGGDSIAARNNPQVSLKVIEALPEVVRRDPKVQISQDVDENTVIFYPDGTLVPGQSKEKQETSSRMSGCSDIVAVAPPGFVWPYSENNRAIFGHVGYKRYHKWHKISYGGSRGLVHFRGWVCKLSGPTSNGDCVGGQYVEKWFGGGFGTDGSAYVPWGNVLASPKARVKSLEAAAGIRVSWR